MGRWTKRPTKRKERAEDGDQIPRALVLRAERGRDDGPGRPVPQAQQPGGAATAEDVEPTHIAITHGHVDHMADAVGVATRTGAECVAIVEIANWLEEQGVEKVHDPNLGGTVRFDWGWVKLVPGLAHEHDRRLRRGPLQPDTGHGHRHPGRPADQPRRADRLPRRRHLPLRRHEADRRAQPGRRRAAADRRPLHDGSPRRGGCGRVHRRRHRDPDALRHLPADRDRRRAFKSEVEAKTSSSVVLLAPGESHSTG